ncbi:MAG: HEAT repeat domain-containing protein [Isosphaeraceae bacterium]
MEGRTSTRPFAILVLAVLAMAAGCSTFIGTTATSFLKKARESDDPNIRYLAYGKLADLHCYDDDKQKEEAAALLISALEPGREPTASRAMICRTLGELRRPEAHAPLLKAAEDQDATVRAEALRALGKVGTTEDSAMLARIMTIDRQAECRIAAIDGLGEIKSGDPKVQALLVENMDHSDPAIRLASLRALRKLSRRDLGVEPGPWKEYVEQLAQAQKPSTPATVDGETAQASGNAPSRR